MIRLAFPLLFSAALFAIGVYGVVAQAVTSRRRELAIRVALGAEPAALVTTSMRRVLSTAAVGVIVGGVSAALATTWLEAVLYGVSPHDALSLSLSSAILLMVVAVAAFIPARRATRVDPMDALGAD